MAGCLGTPLALHAEGLRTVPPGAFDLARSGGRFAHVSDASSVWNNPANMVGLTNTQIQVVSAPIYLRPEFSSSAGDVDTKKPWKALADAFLVVPVKEDQVAAGLGLTMPYGLAIEWDQDQPTNPFYYSAPYRSGMITLNINPSVSVRLLDNLTVGAGLDVMWSQLDIRQNYPWWVAAGLPAPNPLFPDGEAELKASGWGVGGNVAVTWEFVKHHRLAATYRSQQTISYDGDFEISNFPTGFPAGAPSSDASTKIGFPNIVGVGYGVQISDKVRLEINGEWLQWSRFDELVVDTGSNNPLLTGSTAPQVLPQDWKDTFTAGIAGDYQIDDHWAVRGGYQFYESPVPDSTFSPTIPDSNQHVITMGFGYRSGHHNIEFGYGLDLYDKREITNSSVNPEFNGNYKWTVHLFSLSYQYTF